MKILVVDDAEEVRKLLKDYLFCINHEVFIAKDGERAVNIIKEIPISFDLIFTDTEMPKMGGIELTEWVKTNFPKIPVILISGKEEPENHQADAFLQKPLHLRELKATINSLIAV